VSEFADERPDLILRGIGCDRRRYLMPGEVLGEQTYESLAREGETMAVAAIATYAYDQIDQARTELNAVSE
jgi:hypothetical protein